MAAWCCATWFKPAVRPASLSVSSLGSCPAPPTELLVFLFLHIVPSSQRYDSFPFPFPFPFAFPFPFPSPLPNITSQNYYESTWWHAADNQMDTTSGFWLLKLPLMIRYVLSTTALSLFLFPLHHLLSAHPHWSGLRPRPSSYSSGHEYPGRACHRFRCYGSCQSYASPPLPSSLFLPILIILLPQDAKRSQVI